mmetsp:Transcript_56940/g.63792  ORF Transcript_56940/g.63792 Transcript_56940/m.63792 type:complete len:104 (-) Transcript_56940:50-361(-)
MAAAKNEVHTVLYDTTDSITAKQCRGNVTVAMIYEPVLLFGSGVIAVKYEMRSHSDGETKWLGQSVFVVVFVGGGKRKRKRNEKIEKEREKEEKKKEASRNKS